MSGTEDRPRLLPLGGRRQPQQSGDGVIAVRRGGGDKATSPVAGRGASLLE